MKSLLSLAIKSNLKVKSKRHFCLKNTKNILVVIDKHQLFLNDIDSFLKERNYKPIYIVKDFVKKIDLNIHSNIYFYNKDSFNIFGFPKKDFKDFFKNLQIDIIMSFTSEYNLNLKYIISKIDAPIKISINKEHKVYNVSFFEKEEETYKKEFLKKIFEYLNHISK